MKKPLVVLLALTPFVSHAVVDAVSKLSLTNADTAWSWVGQMGGASAVAVGPRTVLTANHVGAGDFWLGGVDYGMASSAAAAAGTDLRVVQLTSDLPGWYSLGSAGKHDAVTMVGYGSVGVVNERDTGYVLTGGGSRHAGENSLSKRKSVKGFGPTLISYLGHAGQSVLGIGDSGGGWFDKGQLVGISSFAFTENAKKAAYGWAKKAYFGSAAIDLTDKGVKKWVTSQILPALGGTRAMALPQTRPVVAAPQAVPEPASWAALGVGVAAFLRRRRR